MDAEPEDRDCKGFEHPQILVICGGPGTNAPGDQESTV